MDDQMVMIGHITAKIRDTLIDALRVRRSLIENALQQLDTEIKEKQDAVHELLQELYATQDAELKMSEFVTTVTDEDLYDGTEY